jgi:hypothetical protein
MDGEDSLIGTPPPGYSLTVYDDDYAPAGDEEPVPWSSPLPTMAKLAATGTAS